MNETTLLALIAKGEDLQIDFKRELDLNTANGKAEFVKDVIAIANSSTTSGFLLIGVENNKSVVGTTSLEEERIQQVVQTYVNPPIVLQCDNIPIASFGFLNVGVVQIRATNRPHKVARNFTFLNQNDVFIRHGSITVKASPEEIIQMHSEDNELNRTSRQYIKSAETHLKLKNYESAIAAFTKALELTPSAEIFLARAKARRLYYAGQYWHETEAQILFTKDLTDAIELATSLDVEKEARLMRFEHGGGALYLVAARDSDFEWLKSNFDGIERAKFIFGALSSDTLTRLDMIVCNPEYAIPHLNEVLQLDYKLPQVYLELAEVHCRMFNYGLALNVIEEAFSNAEFDDRTRGEFLAFRGSILVRIGKYQEARNSYIHARELHEDSHEPYLWNYALKPDVRSILLHYGLAQEFGLTISFAERVALKSLIFNLARSTHEVWTTDNNGKKVRWMMTGLESYDHFYPGIIDPFREIVGEEDWQAILNKRKLAINVTFPSTSGENWVILPGQEQ